MPVKRYDGTNWVTVAGDGAQGPTGPAGASATTIVTTKGDLLSYSTTAARLGVGSNDQVLTADSSTATGLKWATPSAGGMTLISETTASALSSLSLSSIPQTYKQLVLVWGGIFHSVTASGFQMRFNNNSTANTYRVGEHGGRGSSFSISNGGNDRADADLDNASFGINLIASNGVNGYSKGYLVIDNYASTTKLKTYKMDYSYSRSDGPIARSVSGTFASTTAITSIDIVRTYGSATFSNETNTSIRLYGVS
jgi:hypothetical protein